jgi:hypothetical protein
MLHANVEFVGSADPTSADVVPNSSSVHIKNQTHPDLRLATEFRWKPFGVTIAYVSGTDG